MFKIPITYIDFSGNEKTKDFYFNLTKSDIMEIHLSLPNGLVGFIESLNDDPDVDHVVTVFKKLILKSYGKKTSTGSFIKNDDLSNAFAATDAYSELFLKFLDNKDNFVMRFLESAITARPGELKKIFEENKSEEDVLKETELETKEIEESVNSDLPKDI